MASCAFTTDRAKTTALGGRINAGMFGMNHFGIATPETPFGGVDHSGDGSEGGQKGIQSYQKVKFISETGI